MPAIGSFGEKLDLNIRQGACFAFQIKLANPDATPVDLTGASATAMIRKSFADLLPAASFSAAITLPDTIELSLSAAATAGLTAGEKTTDKASLYLWDMEITWPDGCVTSPVYGDLRVKAEVTK